MRMDAPGGVVRTSKEEVINARGFFLFSSLGCTGKSPAARINRPTAAPVANCQLNFEGAGGHPTFYDDRAFEARC